METQKEKKNYIAPQLRVVRFNVERGFAASNPILGSGQGTTTDYDREDVGEGSSNSWF